GIEIHLEHYDAAAGDLAESTRLMALQEDRNADIRRVVQARIDEVRGQSLLHADPLHAVQAFTNALDKASKSYSTFRASLLAQRADALRAAGRNVESENDLRASLDVLHEEETKILENRERGAGEELWNSYFARFQDTYRMLIRRLVDDGKDDEAFLYAERARAVEPLNLVEHLDLGSMGRAPFDIAKLQSSLPPGSLML